MGMQIRHLPPAHEQIWSKFINEELSISKRNKGKKRNTRNLWKISMCNTIPIKCFVTHRRPSREGGSVGRSGKKKRNNEHMIAY